ncbi:MAG: type II secretion system major pseudopilin GspG [Puniceicoccales bacterium]|jgi:general secretion pathway protein G|nr:type II secretion system major pseudopilin GspG [Puniceicoccales bacterium]
MDFHRHGSEEDQGSLFGGKTGFSLIEILIALAILAAVSGIVISNLDKIFGGSQEKVAELFVRETVRTPLMSYRMNVGNYPSTDQGLKALLKAPEGVGRRWKGPYIDELPLDPWGHPYEYRCPGERNRDKYDVWSLGPKGTGGEEAIGNW